MKVSRFPVLYRYLDEKYVDLFFKLGILRISSFEQFKKHKDEARLDIQEGRAKLIGNCCDSNVRVEIGFGISNCFVLCASLTKSQDLLNVFQTDSCFEIVDLPNFIAAITNAMRRMHYIPLNCWGGACCYKPTREIFKNIYQADVDQIRIDDKNHTMDFSALFGLGAKIGWPDILFLKSNEYSKQHEYRIAWDIGRQNIPDHIDLYVPEATKFCKKVNVF